MADSGLDGAKVETAEVGLNEFPTKARDSQNARHGHPVGLSGIPTGVFLKNARRLPFLRGIADNFP